MGEKMNSFVVCCLIAAIVAIAWLRHGLDDVNQQQDLYCEMIGIYKETKGEYGWPDYKGIAGEVCK